jgi:hypothetical protein
MLADMATPVTHERERGERRILAGFGVFVSSGTKDTRKKKKL